MEMKQEDKDLLLKDLCGRLPYGVIVAEFDEDCRRTSIALPLVRLENDFSFYGNLKPYLFPLSSITEEQRKELFYLSGIDIIYGKFYTNNEFTLEETLFGINWLLKKHFDINGLIPKGLAIDATGLNIY